MNNLPRRTLILYICAAITVLGAAYYYLVYNNEPADIVSTDSAAASDAEISFIALVGQIDPIVFDTAILSDPRFMALIDIKTAVIPEATGRRDPFAPFGTR